MTDTGPVGGVGPLGYNRVKARVSVGVSEKKWECMVRK